MEKDEKLLSDEEARNVLKRIDAMFPEAKGELNWDNRFQLLCAVLLSAQTTDKMVNKVTPQLFADFPTPEAMADRIRLHFSLLERTGNFYKVCR